MIFVWSRVQGVLSHRFNYGTLSLKRPISVALGHLWDGLGSEADGEHQS